MSVKIIDLNIFLYDDAISYIKSHIKDKFPVVFRNLDIGICKEKWIDTKELWKSNPDKKVSVHVANYQDLDFKNKNYEYQIMSLKEFIEKASIGEDEKKWYYLRTLGNDVRKDITHFHVQYPEISDDLKIPAVFDQDNYFSSVFRVSSKNCRLWTHFDTMDNILIQVCGDKTIIFFSPYDTEYLYVNDGKSPILNPDCYDQQKYPLFRRATPLKVKLIPGDIVFIPALWYHNVVSHDFSVAVNVFWYSLPSNLYDKRDVYGNKEPVSVARANQSLSSAMKLFDDLPKEFKHVYGLQLIEKIRLKLVCDPEHEKLFKNSGDN